MGGFSLAVAVDDTVDARFSLVDSVLSVARFSLANVDVPPTVERGALVLLTGDSDGLLAVVPTAELLRLRRLLSGVAFFFTAPS